MTTATNTSSSDFFIGSYANVAQTATTGYVDITKNETVGGIPATGSTSGNFRINLTTGTGTANYLNASTGVQINTLLQNISSNAFIQTQSQYNGTSGALGGYSGAGAILGVTNGIMIGSGAGNLTIGQAVSASTGVYGQLAAVTGGGGNLLLINNSSTSTLTINSILGGNPDPDTMTLTKAGVGLLVLANPNNQNSGEVYLDGGTTQVAAGGALGVGTTIFIDNATLQFANNGTGAEALTQTAIALGYGGGTIDTGTNTITYTGSITGSAANGPNGNDPSLYNFTKAGTGTLILTTANNTYQGSTYVNAGNLQVDDSNTGSTGTTGVGKSTGIVYVGANATLSGTGYIEEETQVTGTIAPGTGSGAGTIGTLYVGSGSPGGLIINQGATLAYTLSNTTTAAGGTNNDLINTGTLMLNGVGNGNQPGYVMFAGTGAGAANFALTSVSQNTFGTNQFVYGSPYTLMTGGYSIGGFAPGNSGVGGLYPNLVNSTINAGSNFSITGVPLDGGTFSISGGNLFLTLTAPNSTTYNTSVTAANPRVMVNGSTTATVTVTNAGTTTALSDQLDVTGLNAGTSDVGSSIAGVTSPTTPLAPVGAAARAPMWVALLPRVR